MSRARIGAQSIISQQSGQNHESETGLLEQVETLDRSVTEFQSEYLPPISVESIEPRSSVQPIFVVIFQPFERDADAASADFRGFARSSAAKITSLPRDGDLPQPIKGRKTRLMMRRLRVKGAVSQGRLERLSGCDDHPQPPSRGILDRNADPDEHGTKGGFRRITAIPERNIADRASSFVPIGNLEYPQNG